MLGVGDRFGRWLGGLQPGLPDASGVVRDLIRFAGPEPDPELRRVWSEDDMSIDPDAAASFSSAAMPIRLETRGGRE